MPTLAELLSGDKPGIVWLLDVSFDDFQTVSYRWSTASIRVPSNSFEYDGRIASMSPIERGFGRDRLPAATTVKLRIDNSDFAADWLIDRATVGSQLLQARFRLSVFVYDARAYASAADALSGVQEVISIFMCLDQPEAMANAIDLNLADDSLGRLAEPLTTPSVRDWKDSITPLAHPSLNPFRLYNPVPQMDWDVPLPLVFGQGQLSTPLVPAYAAVAQYMEREETPLTDGSIARGVLPDVKWPLVVCAAKANNQPDGVPEIVELWATLGDDIEGRPEMRGFTIDIPRFGKDANNYWRELWQPRRSAAFSKGGRQWQVVWIDFNVDYYVSWFKREFPDQRLTEKGGLVQATQVPTAGPGSPALAAGAGLALGSRGHIMGAFSAFNVRAGARGALSTVTTRYSEDAGVDVPSVRIVDFIYDVIAYYSKASPSDIDSASFERAAKARATVAGAGIIQPSRPRPLTSVQRNGWISPNPRDGIIGVLRSALGEMCGSADVDLFMKRDGTYALSTIVFDYEAVTGARTRIVESRTSRQRTRTPSDGERWAPYNRVFLQGPGGASYGPYDNQEAIDAWGIIKPLTLQAKWNARLWGENSNAGASTVWMYRTLESKVRPAVRFNADRQYLTLELGDYFEHSWTRGGQSAIFDNTIFRLESQRIDPATLAVELGAIWADDLASVNPYLLDDETLLVRVASSAGRTVSVTDGNTTATFNIGDLGTDGVEAGDILEMKDASQADNVFTRYRRLRIASVDSDKEVTVVAPDDDPDLDFDAPGGATVTTWTIYRGATTYHDSVSDPSNYPDDGDMYGKCCNGNDEYSDASAANQLLDG